MAQKELPLSIPRKALEDIKTTREQKGITQQELADRIDKTRVTYLRFENGQTNLLSETFRKICSELDLNAYVYVLPADREELDIKALDQLLQQKDERIAALEAELEEAREKIRENKVTLQLITELYNQLKKEKEEA
ncbi:MAG: helix-turn-helix domain-containing protein [Bacteroidales bacterium]|nr:helix-turn-helix domain-containing protein [Bacteroidales bacterium]